MATSGSVGPKAMQELLRIAASLQTEASWLHGHACRTSTRSEEPGSLDVLCDTEFKEDFVKLFKKSLRTLPSVGLPTLLAYRPESSRENTQTETEEDSAPRCEYCGSLLEPFPAAGGEACPPPQGDESKFCCQSSRDLYEFIVNERRNHEATWSIPAAISPPRSHRTEDNRLLSKELTKERAHQKYCDTTTGRTGDRVCTRNRQQERQVARELAVRAAEAPSAAECLSQAGTISYLLSQEPPSPTGRTLMPGERAAEPEEEPISCSITCCDFTLVGGKVAKNELLEKYYKHGGKFLTMFPDGTVQLLYPSGNLAIIVVREKNQLICMAQEDKPSDARIQAVFNSSGRSTCCYPSGAVWINMNVQGGQYFDQAGSRLRRWTWPNRVMSSGPQVPLSPIFISLNQHVGVRILGQDKIVISFLAMGQQAKFNVGTKVQASTGGRLPPPAQLGHDELLLLAFRVRILRLLDRLRGCLNFPSNEQQDKIKPPAYLITQTLKILQLCASSGVSDELHSLVRAKVKADV